MVLSIRSSSGMGGVALLLSLLAAPHGVSAQAAPDAPDLVQVLSEQSFQDSMTGASLAAPPRVAGRSVNGGGPRAITAAAGTGFRCLPSCNPVDGRFLAVAGANLVTLSGREMNLTISVPAGTSSFNLGIFDGDVRATDGAGVSHWDIGVASLYEYTLYADPFGDGTGTTVVQMQPGLPSIPSTSMPDNAWIDFTIPTDSSALAPSGNYFYRLTISLTVPTLTTLNAFKVRATAVVSGLTLDPETEPFSYIASFTSVGDAQTVYPNYPASNTPANYDGTFEFYFDLPVSKTEITVWDGDFDRGKYNGTELDTDDPDTPALPLPPWSTLDTLPEGVALGLLGTTGNPPDDRNPLPATTGNFVLKPPSVRYDLFAPNAQTFSNENPSGNQEWEQFKITTVASDPLVDAYASSLHAGTYRLRVAGVDMQNLNALLLPGRVLCLEEDGSPCTPLRPFLAGDTVFKDGNRNGTQENEGGSEPGIAGVTLELVDELGFVLATAVTDGEGQYSFPVQAYTYTVRIAASNHAPGGPLAGFAATTEESRTETVVDDNVLTFDYGYCGTGSLGDYVWLDTNGDGVQDPDETGLPDVFIELLDGDGNVVDQTTTDADGKYKFGNLAPGDYTLRIDPLSRPGLTASADLDGATTPDETAVTLGAGQERTDVDFGYSVEGHASIGDRVWLDADGDGVQDSDEAGIPGVTVGLLDGDGNEVATTTTGADGIYGFDSLKAGTYTVAVEPATLPSGAVATFDRDGIGTLHRATLTVTADDQVTNVDFGYRGSASLGDRVWLDLNGDTSQSAGENGINGVTVQLVDSSGNLVASTVTAGDGNYTFNNLLAGTYTVRLVAATLPPGSTQTYDLDGTGTPHSAVVTVAGGATRADVDFGYRGNGSLGDRVWLDKNGNSSQDSGEPGLNGVTVQLLNGSGGVIATTTTAGDGNYSFTNLAAGSYTVRVVAATLPAGTVPTYDLDGTGTAHTAAVTLAAGGSRGDVDFGYRGTASIGDRVWLDANGNGAQDSGETGLTGVTVELLNSGSTVIATTTTAANGIYTFSNLVAGSYTVRVVSSTLPAGSTPTFDPDGIATAHTAAVTLTGGQTRADVDFGYRGTASIGDRVWNDADGDGVQNTSETGLTGVTVELLNSGGTVIATTTTGSNGAYTFGNLAAGSYTVRVVSSTLPAGMTPTYDLDGIATAHTAAVTLAGGQTRTDADFGYRTPPVSCTAGYFKDHFNNASFSNNDGTLTWAGSWIESDSAGAGVSSGNVTVGSPYAGYLFLRDYPDTGTQPSAARQANLTGFTAATLSFSFHVRTAVDPDDAVVIEISNNGGSTYTVLETLNGFTGTYEGTRSYDISAYIASNTRIRFRVTNNYGASDELFKVDWVRIDGTCTPATQTGSIGNRVWNDTDGDGSQDSSEAGINGVTVQLLNSGGTLIATTTTAGNGDYNFANLAAGSYSVKVVSSTLPAGLTPTYDLDGIATAHVAAVTLTTGQARTDVDFGYKTAPVSCTAGNFKDNFSSASFSNNDGSLTWAGAWVESDTAGTGVGSGNVTVGSPYSGYLILRDFPDTGTQPSAARQANLTGFATATLQLAYHTRPGVDADDAVVIEVSKDGGSTYTVLETLTGIVGQTTGSRTYDISAYIASNTRIRFRVSANYGADDELFKVDWVRIDGSCSTTPPSTSNGSIGNRVWFDYDGDKAQDASEPGINGVTVQLLNSSGTVIATAATATNGNYTFSNLAAGSYSVKIVASSLPAGTDQTYDLDGLGTSNVAAVTLTTGQNRTDADFGYQGNICIGDRVWNDKDSDKSQDSNESGIANVTVQLWDAEGHLIATDVTDSSGNYSFNNLLTGTYTIKVVSSTLPSGTTQTFDRDGTATPHAATLAFTASRSDIDFGYKGSGTGGGCY